MEEQVLVTGSIINSINFAMQQNYVPMIRNMIVKNNSEEKLENLVVKITFDPEFAMEYSYPIDEVEAGEAVEISPVSIHLKTDFLFSLTEKMVGTIRLVLMHENDQIFEKSEEIELLAYDQWSGLCFMPEIIAAFVTPNHPAIAGIISDASAILKKWKGNPSFTGYQTQNPNNVKYQMAAVYAALHDRRIIYNNPPASYETVGQRVRLPHTVLEQKQGTCLDLAVLYASCIEAIGLYPLLIFIEGHAFAGCWLEENTFADCAIDDVSAIEKRIADGAEELLLVECTDFVAGNDIDFDRAIKHARDHISDPQKFQCVVDIKRSRGSGIHPIPLQLNQAYEYNQKDDKIENKLIYEAPKEIDNSLLGKTAEGKESVSKIRIWERKLLDFSLRNSLLNFRPTKSAIQFMTADIGELEDGLSDGKDFRIMEVPKEWAVSLRDSRIYEIENDRDLVKTIATEEFKSQRIRTFLAEDELNKTLKDLYRSAKMSMEENGTNTLFLALGFLRWFESDVAERPRFAPIVLIPVDLVRNMRDKGYIIRSRQEDPQVNITLLEYLKQDHGVNISGLDPLPEDEHGIDLPLIFNTVRQAIMGKKRWNVEEMAFVGLFSFGQFVMWNDLRNRADELQQNKVVASLIKGAMTWQPEELETTLDNMDDVISLSDMAVPVSADSSQMMAITAAAQGQSFVLHGPPGTGKSQTITNMIANALYQGKSVLFVAEKMAALSVVQKRLAAIGLDPFSLELHSNKTNKTAVLAELEKSLEVGKIKSPEEYQAIADKIHELRGRLNDVLKAVHSIRKYGCSLYEAIEVYEQNSVQKGTIEFSRDLVFEADKAKVTEWEELIRSYIVAVQEIGNYAQHPLNGYGGQNYSIEIRENFVNEAENLIQTYKETDQAASSLIASIGLVRKNKSLLEKATNVIRALTSPAATLPEMICHPMFTDVIQKSQDLIETGKKYIADENFFMEKFEPAVYSLQSEEAMLKWKQAENSWFLPKMLGQSKLLKQMRMYAKNATDITKDNIVSIYARITEYNTLKKKIQEMPQELTGLYDGIFMGIQTDWQTLETAVNKARQIYQEVMKFDVADRKPVMASLYKTIDTGSLAKWNETVSEYLNNVQNFEEKYEVSFAEDSDDYLKTVKDKLQQFKDHVSELHHIVLFNQADRNLCNAGLENVSNAYRKGMVDAENLQSAFDCNLYYALTLMTIAQDERLGDFHGKQYDDLILQYHDAINQYQKLTVQELVARLSAKIPVSGTASAASSEMGILKKAIKSNGRMMSLRKLFQEIPTLLRKLCPCMLMSPISVAQYIDPSFPKFDLVIFDEASQLPTSEAAGTIARGENVVIVGDPKQLPPTNFFSSNRMDEDNSEKEDLESLLDDCLAISMPQEYLKWHYRSRHESLIAYSNMKYYDNKLFTFPSPQDLISEVKMVHVDGIYDKGRTKQNKAEAEAIVKEIVRRLQDEKLRKDSIGVVTFSSVQQNLIDDMLMDEFTRHPELEEIDRNAAEPVFIKNLENVQGDERDVILFSVGYGPDANGNVSMNFGPLNRDGGWRRLNVAISRARKSMIVYAVIRPDQINLSRTRSEGVAGLKGFLEYAEHGKSALVQNASSSKVRDDYLIDEIAGEIRKIGYDVKCNVGCSEYRIDLGIVNPEEQETYLLGILLDGENCNAAATARDRFVLQPGVLNGLGWSIIRVWTLDWLDDKQYVLEEIKKAIDRAQNSVEPEQIDNKQENYKNMPVKFEQEEKIIHNAREIYHSAEIPVIGKPDSYYEDTSIKRIQSITAAIIAQEAPISRKALMRKVLSAWEISRGGSRVEMIFAKALSLTEKCETADEDRVFLWTKDQDPVHYDIYRVEDQHGNRRNMDDIPSQEIETAIVEVLNEQIGLSEIDLIRETAKKFGFARLGNTIDSTIRYAIRETIKKGIISMAENGNIVNTDLNA